MKLSYHELSQDYNMSDDDVGFLYLLLASRKDHENISHKVMPTFSQHASFVKSNPYQHWFIIRVGDDRTETPIGAIYLSRQSEIGIHIMPEYRGNGYGTEALNWLLAKYTSDLAFEFYANINPANEKSIKLFEKAGFKHVQNTYKLN